MAELRIGGLTLNLGSKLEDAVGEAADSLLYAQTKAWLATAGRCLPRDHRALLEMRQLVDQYEKAKGLGR